MKTSFLSLVLVLFISACAHAADSSATDTSLAKMTTQVVAEKQTVRLGDPIIVSVNVSNQTSQVKQMTSAVSSSLFDNLEITDPDGKNLPYVGFAGQFGVSANMVAVQPHSTVTITESLDLTQRYLFQKAGRYSIRFSGGGGLSNSPAIAIQVTAGRLSEIDDVVASLLPMCPKGWYLAKSLLGEAMPVGPGFTLHLYHNPIIGGSDVQLWFTKEEAKVDPDQQTRLRIQYLGQARGQFVYGSVDTNVPALWPTAIEDISRALQITK